MPRVISASDIDFSPDASTPVLSDTLRFLIPVPKFRGGGEPLVQPGGGGVLFFNPDDQCWQAAHGDGQAVVIVAGIDEDEARRLKAKIAEFGPDPSKLPLKAFKAVLDYARDDAGGIAIYDSDRATVARTMTRVEPDGGIEVYGLYRRNKDLCAAVFV